MTVRPSPRRDRLLDAAEHLFSRDGVRATTMEGVAREAEVAKATAYAHFPNKDVLFAAVAERVAARLADLSLAALATPDPHEAVIAGLQAKYGETWRLVWSSPHAGDLLASRDRLARAAFAEADARIAAELVRRLGELGTVPPAAALGPLLLAACAGLVKPAATAEALAADIRQLATLALAGARG